ncbi:hypothetical protein P175DRAFT_0497750 [Aspergillus ochraceoroseus IBT 24754]|uniref:Uncharacterized protein n=1 Tax=Aspergillus ochraceoroseus IBT 24754 TaxID=1392256 RepID=A0A2T5M7Z7_9EURO|nr:uncharacterized protein P175DRAFT_0497750 [Aspergillus ochraceoroseus IBT 24754]PTU24645.1 hypothetical protein P175DRAFT_0497750 [Aspergillus ochraceoroseus IBT 24754]
MAFMRPLLHAWKSPFRHMRKRSSQHDHSVDFTQFLSQWPYKTGSSMFSRDVCSLVCASAYPTPATEASQDRNELDLRGIMVQTSIDRDVQDRGVVLASILGGTRSMIESIGLSSRRESAGY